MVENSFESQKLESTATMCGQGWFVCLLSVLTLKQLFSFQCCLGTKTTTSEWKLLAGHFPETRQVCPPVKQHYYSTFRRWLGPLASLWNF